MNKLKTILKNFEKAVYNNEASFMEKFVGFSSNIELVRLSFSSEEVFFVYLLDSGRHIGDSTPIEDFYKWVESGVSNEM